MKERDIKISLLESKLAKAVEELFKNKQLIDKLMGRKKYLKHGDEKKYKDMARTDLEGDLDIEEDALIKVKEVRAKISKYCNFNIEILDLLLILLGYSNFGSIYRVRK